MEISQWAFSCYPFDLMNISMLTFVHVSIKNFNPSIKLGDTVSCHSLWFGDNRHLHTHANILIFILL